MPHPYMVAAGFPENSVGYGPAPGFPPHGFDESGYAQHAAYGNPYGMPPGVSFAVCTCAVCLCVCGWVGVVLRVCMCVAGWVLCCAACVVLCCVCVLRKITGANRRMF
jgi:hypothetical protein